MSRESFRPLAGISCVVRVLGRRRALPGFRPLAGISCVDYPKPCLLHQ